MTVWTVDKVGYPEECYQLFIAESEEAAVRLLKEHFGPPYRVTWTEEREGDTVRLAGAFDAVANFALAHTSNFVIAPCEVRR